VSLGLLSWGIPKAIKERRLEVARLLQSGATEDQIIESIGASKGTIRQDIKEVRAKPGQYGLSQSPPEAQPARDGKLGRRGVSLAQNQKITERRERVLRLFYFECWPAQAIAKKEGVSREQIRLDQKALQKELGADGLELVRRAANQGRLPAEAPALYPERDQARSRGARAVIAIKKSGASLSALAQLAEAGHPPAAIAAHLGVEVGRVEAILNRPGPLPSDAAEQ
jgi:transposase